MLQSLQFKDEEDGVIIQDLIAENEKLQAEADEAKGELAEARNLNAALKIKFEKHMTKAAEETIPRSTVSERKAEEATRIVQQGEENEALSIDDDEEVEQEVEQAEKLTMEPKAVEEAQRKEEAEENTPTHQGESMMGSSAPISEGSSEGEEAEDKEKEEGENWKEIDNILKYIVVKALVDQFDDLEMLEMDLLASMLRLSTP